MVGQDDTRLPSFDEEEAPGKYDNAENVLAARESRNRPRYLQFSNALDRFLFILAIPHRCAGSIILV
ncbi:hypothetical protein [Paracoccus acridae]|uniref:hypothetical protein n=1 Tax=Paracoccus acridae TaxID=1795310 RepID=UPI00166739C0|nr:hypothetical protein [Paracoccus acridae]